MAQENDLFPSIGKLAVKADGAYDSKGSPSDTRDGLHAENEAIEQVDSLCMNCNEQGVTRMMLTFIPYFREVIVMSFRCEHCGHQNNEIQSAGQIQTEGVVYTTRIRERSDLDRQIVRSPTCEIIIPELELTLPPTSRGQLSTIEGFLRNVYADLSMDQPLRRIQAPDQYSAIQSIAEKLRDIIGDQDDEDRDAQTKSDTQKISEKDAQISPFTLKLDDPAGNSWIEFIESTADPKWSMHQYRRTLEQNIALGLVSEEANEISETLIEGQELPIDAVTDDEVFVFHGHCSSCGHPSDTKMKKVTIPYFKDVMIMSTNCERCGYRDNEVKAGSAISEKGKRITLKVEDREDLSRDILKSETAGLAVPEIELELKHGTLGGRFTTLEGILSQVHEELSNKVFAQGDASNSFDKTKLDAFLKNLEQIKNVERPFTVILDDPLANSYLQNLNAPDPDPNLTIELYDRTWEQNEELGINDMKVEGYESDTQNEAAKPISEQQDKTVT